MSQIYCPDCGQPFDGEFALSYHRKMTHQVKRNIDVDELEKARKRMKGSAIAGIVSGTITTIFALTGILGFSPWNLLDAGLAFGLSIGVFMKNRACAVILLIYWILEKLYQISAEGLDIFGLFVAVLFGVFFFQGILGTFAYHRLIRESVVSKPHNYDMDAAAKELHKDYSKGEIDKMKGSNEHILFQ